MQRLGIVDLGSNTARLVVYLHEPGRWFRLVDGIREPVRLGQGLGLAGRLEPDAIERALAALRLFFDYAGVTGLDGLEVIGTSALRDARNSLDFMRRAAPLDLDITVLSGEQEAQLSVSAVANGFDLEDAWVIDLGGGSAQLSLMRGRRCREGRAFPLGTIRLSEAYLASDPPRRRQIKALERTVAEHLEPLARRLRDSPLPLVAIGGSIRNLARVSQEMSQDPLGILHGYFFTRAELEETFDELLALPVARRAGVPGLNPDRADLILAGALLFRWLLRNADRDGLLISGHGVREGAFYRHFLPPPFLLDDVRGFSVRNLQEQWAQRLPHVSRVVHLARQIFHALAPLHGLGEEEGQLLEAAGHLHDIGMAVDYHRHHKHGAYLVRSVSLPGFSQREQALIALLVRYHRKGMPKRGRFRTMTRRRDKRILLQLATCLRLAEQLERSRAGRVSRIRVRIGTRSVRLSAVAAELPTVELWEAAKHADLFRRAFKRRLKLKPAVE